MAKQERDKWHTRIKEVEREFIAARKAADDLLTGSRLNPSVLPPDTRVRDAQKMSQNLEGTYLIRLFAAFEVGLRSYWRAFRETNPTSRDLIDSIAAKRTVPDDVRDDVHRIRLYRNSVVHEEETHVDPIALKIARRHLQEYLSRLPDQW